MPRRDIHRRLDHLESSMPPPPCRPTKHDAALAELSAAVGLPLPAGVPDDVIRQLAELTFDCLHSDDCDLTPVAAEVARIKTEYGGAK